MYVLHSGPHCAALHYRYDRLAYTAGGAYGSMHPLSDSSFIRYRTYSRCMYRMHTFPCQVPGSRVGGCVYLDDIHGFLSVSFYLLVKAKLIQT